MSSSRIQVSSPAAASSSWTPARRPRLRRSVLHLLSQTFPSARTRHPSQRGDRRLAPCTVQASRPARGPPRRVKGRRVKSEIISCPLLFSMARLVVGNLHCNYERECHLGSSIRLPLHVHASSPFWNLTARQDVLFSSHEKAQKTQRITHFMDRVLLSLCLFVLFRG